MTTVERQLLRNQSLIMQFLFISVVSENPFAASSALRAEIEAALNATAELLNADGQVAALGADVEVDLERMNRRLQSTDWLSWGEVDADCSACAWKGKVTDAVGICGEEARCPVCGSMVLVKVGEIP